MIYIYIFRPFLNFISLLHFPLKCFWWSIVIGAPMAQLTWKLFAERRYMVLGSQGFKHKDKSSLPQMLCRLTCETGPNSDWLCCQGGGLNLDFLATGRFVHTALTDQTLNTIYGPWLFVHYSHSCSCWRICFFHFHFHPYQSDKGSPKKMSIRAWIADDQWCKNFFLHNIMTSLWWWHHKYFY